MLVIDQGRGGLLWLPSVEAGQAATFNKECQDQKNDSEWRETTPSKANLPLFLVLLFTHGINFLTYQIPFQRKNHPLDILRLFRYERVSVFVYPRVRLHRTMLDFSSLIKVQFIYNKLIYNLVHCNFRILSLFPNYPSDRFQLFSIYSYLAATNMLFVSIYMKFKHLMQVKLCEERRQLSIIYYTG